MVAGTIAVSLWSLNLELGGSQGRTKKGGVTSQQHDEGDFECEKENSNLELYEYQRKYSLYILYGS